MSNIAVSNSTCLIGLERIDQLKILEQSFDTIFIPPAVQEEIGFTRSWLKVKPVQNISVIKALDTQLDKGESEAIALVMELGDVYLILDDKKARRIAQMITPLTIGTIGLLLRAKRKGMITKIKPILDALHKNHFRISDLLYKQALQLAKE